MRNGTLWLIAICVGALSLVLPPAASASSTDQIVNDTRKFVEWAFGFKLDPASVQSIRDGTAIDMSSDASGVQATVNDMDNVMAYVAKHSASDSAMLRSLIEPQLVAVWQADTGASSATSRAMVAAWRKHNRIIAEGRPPLRRSIVDAYIAMYEFTAKQAGKPVPAAIADHDAFARRIAGQYAAAPADSQMKFNQIQPLWLSFQALWAQSTPAQQNALRAAFRAKPVAVRPLPTVAPQSGMSGVEGLAKEFSSEHLFVQSESRLMMSSWSNPFIH